MQRRVTNIGRLIAVVGPSGVGKDSLIEGLCEAEPSLFRCKRVITRAANAGGEDFVPESEATFLQRVERDDFLLWWRAHGLCYGIPRSVTNVLTSGRDVIANLSRTVLEEAASEVSNLVVFMVTASPGVLAERLSGRARESQSDIARRLARPAPAMPERLETVKIRNDGELTDAVNLALRALYKETV